MNMDTHSRRQENRIELDQNGEKINLVEGTFEEFVAAMLNPKSAAGAMAKKFLNDQENIDRIRNILKI